MMPHLGMTRLSIIDLAGGHQPMANETEDCWIVFNGEIYNFLDLRKELKSRGISLPDSLGYRSRFACIRRMGRGLFAPAARHVCARHL